MQFDKPKVTIDLDEYQHLKDQENKLKDSLASDRYYEVAKIILYAFMRFGNQMNDVKSYLDKHGVSFYREASSRDLSHESISISYKPINK